MAATTKAQRMAAIKKRGEAERAAMASDMAAFEARMAAVDKQIARKNEERHLEANKTIVAPFNPAFVDRTNVTYANSTQDGGRNQPKPVVPPIYNNSSQDGGRNQRSGYAAHNGVPAMNAAVAQVQNAAPTKVPSSPIKASSGGVTPWASLSSGWVNPFTNEVEDTGKAAGRSVGGTVDNIVDGASAYGGMVYDAAGNLINNTSDAASGFVEGFLGSRDPSEKAEVVPGLPTRPTTQADVDAYGRKASPMDIRPTTQADVDAYSREEAAAPSDVPSATPEVVSDTANPKELVPALEPITLPDAAVSTIAPPSTETAAEVDARIKEEFEASKADATETGTDDGSGINLKTFEATDGEGNKIPVPPEQVKGIFDKASDLFGDIFSASDLKRMTLYTLGGLLSGGSFGGSFKWAGMKVMEEQSIAKANQAKKDEKTLDYERIVARELTSTDAATLAAMTLREHQAIAARLLASTNATKAEIKALALKNYQELTLNTSRDNSIRQSEATLAAKQLTLDAKNVRVGQPTSTTQGYNAQGIANMPFLEATQRYGKNDTKYFTVDVPGSLFDSKADDSLVTVELNGFKKWARLPENRHLGIDLAKGNNSDNLDINQLEKVMDIADKLSGTVEKAFDNSELDSLAASESVASHLIARGYKITNPEELAHIRHLTALTANDAAAYARANGNMRIDNMAPFFDKAALSVAAGAPGEGVWGIKHTTRLLGKVSYTSVDTKKVGLLAKTLLDKAGGDFGIVKREFEKMYNHYTKVKAGDVPGEEIPLLKFEADENEFYAWATKKLAKT